MTPNDQAPNSLEGEGTIAPPSSDSHSATTHHDHDHPSSDKTTLSAPLFSPQTTRLISLLRHQSLTRLRSAESCTKKADAVVTRFAKEDLEATLGLDKWEGSPADHETREYLKKLAKNERVEWEYQARTRGLTGRLADEAAAVLEKSVEAASEDERTEILENQLPSELQQEVCAWYHPDGAAEDETPSHPAGFDFPTTLSKSSHLLRHHQIARTDMELAYTSLIEECGREEPDSPLHTAWWASRARFYEREEEVMKRLRIGWAQCKDLGRNV